MNLYSYVTNNPINYVDPMGLLTSEQFIAYTSGFGRGFAQGTADQFRAGADFWRNAFKGGVEFGPHPGSGADTAGKLGGCGAQIATQALSGVAIGASAIAGLAQAGVITNYSFTIRGGELVGSHGGQTAFRINPFGSPNSSNPLGRRPHYHRRIIDPKTGQTKPGGGIGKHRPWEGF